MLSRSLASFAGSLSLVVAASCGAPQGPEPQPSASPVADTAKPDTGPLEASYNGAPVRFATALVQSRGPDVLDIVLAPMDAACDKAGLHDGSPGEKRAFIRLANMITSKGRSWRLARASYDNRTAAQGGEVQFEGDATKGVVVTLPEIALAGTTMTFAGPVRAKGCGAASEAGSAPARVQPGGTFEVGGVKLTPHTVTVKRSADRDRFVVSTYAISCDLSSSGVHARHADFILELPKSGEARASLTGDLIPSPAGDHFFKDTPPKVEIGTISEGSAPVTIQANYSHGELAVNVSGTFQAAVCE